LSNFIFEPVGDGESSGAWSRLPGSQEASKEI